ncbi:hypothetical protein GCM10010472_02410 [Pseudonocardia halophobica]|uniref:SnoaL-like domain-containing protein n=1 Tax=Pseudonocardia halophobica TaxID=29401 RepID=A0A9W6L1R3_9PSEU|nr:nuclear transport factor 2 family protein [Pseudonocardia halophobica]GLL10581.1 hypothetical protein GCM10017577_17210 [Pseudonocardia halophobica]
MYSEEDLRLHLDRAAIQAVLVRYVNANGADDFDGMAACFAEDGGMEGGQSGGRAALRERFSTIRPRSCVMWSVDKIVKTQHLLTNVEIDVQKDDATSFCGATTYVLAERAGEPLVIVRGITYTDTFVRSEDEGWLIKNRTHDLIWSYETPALTGVH